MVEISKSVLRIIGQTNARYGLIGEGDRVLLGLSGGKDSMMLASALARLKAHAPFNFDFLALTIHYGLGEDFGYLEAFCRDNAIPHEIYHSNIARTIDEKRRENSSFCSFCSRLRRGALYSYARTHGYNKLAIGHHLDDAMESFFMNLSYNGALRSLAPIYRADNGIYVIRPLIHVREAKAKDFVSKNALVTAPECNCPARQPANSKPPVAREKTKALLASMERENKDLFKSFANALGSLHLNTLFDTEYLELDTSVRQNLSRSDEIKRAMNKEHLCRKKAGQAQSKIDSIKANEVERKTHLDKANAIERRMDSTKTSEVHLNEANEAHSKIDSTKIEQVERKVDSTKASEIHLTKANAIERRIDSTKTSEVHSKSNKAKMGHS